MVTAIRAFCIDENVVVALAQGAQHPGELAHGTGVITHEIGDAQLVGVIINNDVDIPVIDGMVDDLVKPGLSGEPLAETGCIYRLILRVIKPPAQRLLRIGVNEADFFALGSKITTDVNGKGGLADAALGRDEGDDC